MVWASATGGRTTGTRAALAAVGLTFLGGVVACGCGDPDPVSTRPLIVRPIPSTSDPAEVEAVEKALAAYDGFQKAYIAAAADPEIVAKGVDKYAGSPLKLETHLALRRMAASGIVVMGRPSWSARVTAVNVTAPPFAVMIEACFDQTGWRSVYKASGRSAAVPGQAQRYVIEAKAELYGDGRWLVSTSEPHRDRPC